MVTTLKRINPLVYVQISVDILVELLIADITNFSISVADILLIQYISTPLPAS